MWRQVLTFALGLVVCIAALGVGEAQATQPMKQLERRIGRAFFPPDLIIGARRDLQLSDAQTKAIKKIIKRHHNRNLELRFELQDAVDALNATLEKPKVNSARALQQADKVLAVETKLKRLHLSMLIELRNTLTSQQVAKLREIRKTQRKQRKRQKKRKNRAFPKLER